MLLASDRLTDTVLALYGSQNPPKRERHDDSRFSRTSQVLQNPIG